MARPTVYKNDWFIFPYKTYLDIDLAGCSLSIDGKCEDTKTVEECVDKCAASSVCKYGYFVETNNGNICVPLLSLASEPDAIGAFYRMRNQISNPDLNGMKSYTFMTNKDETYPPDSANVIFYSDHFNMKIAGKFLNMSQPTDGKANIITGNEGTIVRLLSKDLVMQHSRYLPVRHGDVVVLNIPQTDFVWYRTDGEIIWYMISERSQGGIQFTITAVGKNIGDLLDYTDSIMLTSFDNPISLDDSGGITAVEANIKDLHPEDYTFQFVPKVEVYYCDGTNCKSTSLELTVSQGKSARVGSALVHRSPSCWNLCPRKKTGIPIPVIMLGIGLILVLIIFILRNKTRVIEYAG